MTMIVKSIAARAQIWPVNQLHSFMERSERKMEKDDFETIKRLGEGTHTGFLNVCIVYSNSTPRLTVDRQKIGRSCH